MDVKPLEEDLQRRGKECGVHRLQDKVIIVLGLEKLDDLSALPAFRQAMFDLLAKVRTPPPEIIVRVNDRDAPTLRPFLQRGNPLGSGQRTSQERLRAWKVPLRGAVMAPPGARP